MGHNEIKLFVENKSKTRKEEEEEEKEPANPISQEGIYTKYL